jgi:signal transduction histidine kinase/phage shock protein PspC (stress-responsive transcriptional regulator)
MSTRPLAFARSEDGRVVAGVVAGFSRRHGVDPWVVRGALVVLSFAAGLGLVLYALGAAFSEDAPVAGTASSRPVDPLRNASVGCITIGVLAVVRSTGLWLGDALMVPLAIVVAGAVVLAVAREGELAPGQFAPGQFAPGQFAGVMSGRHARARIVVGAGLVVVGLVSVGLGRSVSGTVRVGVFAAAVSIAGVVVLVGPWIARLAQTAAEERRQRVRSEERAAMAAHLHDSVLQTLALIQRSDDPRRTASLARQQEHELRAWLFGDSTRTEASLVAAVTAMVHDVERRHEVRIEVVAVGDAPLDDAGEALVAAAREACVNAAKHSGETSMSVFVEVGNQSMDVFVRDRGRGFDRGAVADGHGIQHSIEERTGRVGGEVEIRTTPGEGTEVHLRVPRAAADTPSTPEVRS